MDSYFNELETLMLKINLDESEEAKIARFISGLRRDIQDVVELQEYSSLQTLVHLAIKVENQIARKMAFKNSTHDGYYKNSLKKKKNLFQSFLLKIHLLKLRILSLPLLIINHQPNPQVKSVLNV